MDAAANNSRTMSEGLRFKLIFDHTQARRATQEVKRQAKGLGREASREINKAENASNRYAKGLHRVGRASRQVGRDLRTMSGAFGGFSRVGGRALRIFGGLSTSIAAAGGAMGPLGVGAAAGGVLLLGTAGAAAKLTLGLIKVSLNARETYEALEEFRSIDGFLPELSDTDLRGFYEIEASTEALKASFQATSLIIAREFSPTLQGLMSGVGTTVVAVKELVEAGGNIARVFREMPEGVLLTIKVLKGLGASSVAAFAPMLLLVDLVFQAADAFNRLTSLPLEAFTSTLTSIAAGVQGLADGMLGLSPAVVQAAGDFGGLQAAAESLARVLYEPIRQLNEVEAAAGRFSKTFNRNEKGNRDRDRDRDRRRRESERRAREAVAAERQRVQDLVSVNSTLSDARIRTIGATDEQTAAVMRLLGAHDRQLAGLSEIEQRAREEMRSTREGTEAYRQLERILQQVAAARAQLGEATTLELEGLDASAARKVADEQQAAMQALSAESQRLVAGQITGEEKIRAAQRERYQDVARLQRAAVEAARGNADLIAQAEEQASRARVAIEQQTQEELAALRAQERDRALQNLNTIGGYAQRGLSMVATAADQAYQTSADTVSRLQDQLAAGEEHYTAAQKKALRQRVRAAKEAARDQFQAAKAAKIAEAFASTALAAINAIAQSPPPSPFGLIGAGIATAAGAAAVQQIQGQQPTFHRGGFGDEIPVTMTRREAVLSPIGRQALGDDAIRSANAGMAQGGQVIEVRQYYKHRSYDVFARDNLNRGGPLSRAISHSQGGDVHHRGARNGA